MKADDLMNNKALLNVNILNPPLSTCDHEIVLEDVICYIKIH